MSPHRRFALLAACVVACGLDESGLLPGDASLGGDGGSSDVLEEPIGCQAVDASACIDAAIPANWSLIAFSASSTSCPGDFDSKQFSDKLQLEAGACACGCTPSGSYSCSGSVQFGDNCGNCGGGVGGCSQNGTLDAGNAAACVPAFNQPDFGIAAPPSLSAGTASCDASVTGNQATTATAVTVCAPHCTADYCAASGFQRCIVSQTETQCPSPFLATDTIGDPSAVTVACGCSCTAAPNGSCTASVVAYSGAGCTGNTTNVNVPGCETTGGTGMASFRYTPTVPTVGCAPVQGDAGVAFNAPLTVCCLP